MKLDPKRHAWMTAPETLMVLNALGGKGKFVGGAVRNALLGKPVADIDIATPLHPDDIVAHLKKAGIGAVPTGIEHGTITAVANGKPLEITTLRRDVSTDGRRATVAFTDDWALDAQRRDFTMNALYADADGEILDTVGGVEDLKAGHVRFVGDPLTRIREDYLRILRLFRFHAWYGKGEIDAPALHAAAEEKTGLIQLSGERVQKELLRLLEADDPGPVLRTMAATGILTELLPGALDIARLEHLARIDAEAFFTPDPVLRLAALLPPDEVAAEALAKKLRLSNAAAERIADLAGARETLKPYSTPKEVRQLVYRLGLVPFKDRVFLRWAADSKLSNGISWRMLLSVGESWVPARFPLTGRDVMLAGVPEGPMIGIILKEVEDWWIDADFIEDEFSLAERLKAVVQATAY
jgi:poly(A) polymerase